MDVSLAPSSSKGRIGLFAAGNQWVSAWGRWSLRLSSGADDSADFFSSPWESLVDEQPLLRRVLLGGSFGLPFLPPDALRSSDGVPGGTRYWAVDLPGPGGELRAVLKSLQGHVKAR